MKNKNFLSVLLILLCFSSNSNVSAQATYGICYLASTIEALNMVFGKL